MNRAAEFLTALRAADVRTIYGVPDSLLAPLISEAEATWPTSEHMIATNEGTAVALAIGSYLGTGRPAAVYLQNSGLGNAINPLVSLADPQVYSVPMVLVIGWRGEVREDGSVIADEPQHRSQGRITASLLDTLGIAFRVVDERSDLDQTAAWAVAQAHDGNRPTALLVRKAAFGKTSARAASDSDLMTREQAIAEVLGVVGHLPLVATTGMASREVYELRRARGERHDADFLTVGGMGHALGIAIGLARSRPDQRIVCLDGDGALLMHMGTMGLAARTPNLLHIVINNGAHDSVGGQPTLAAVMPLRPVAQAMGYAATNEAEEAGQLRSAAAAMAGSRGSAFLEVRCRTGSRADLGRPDQVPAQALRIFMSSLDGAPP
jgi:phosphonopyruvate decarboxylase